MENVALGLLVIFGVIVAALSAVGVLAPARLIAFVKGVWRHRSGMYLAVGVRVVIGILLIAAAPYARFPLAFEILGWIAIVAAGAVLIAGKERIDHLLKWGTSQSPNLLRAWCVGGIAFGVFLVLGSIR